MLFLAFLHIQALLALSRCLERDLYGALTLEAAIAAAAALAEVRFPEAAMATARDQANALAGSLTMTGRFALALRRTPPMPPLPANDADITHAWSDACGCDLCVTTGAELVALADARRADALAHQEALLDAWPCELPSLPWHLDHEPDVVGCAAEVA